MLYEWILIACVTAKGHMYCEKWVMPDEPFCIGVRKEFLKKHNENRELLPGGVTVRCKYEKVVEDKP